MGEDSQQLPSRIWYWLTEAQHDCFFLVGPEDGPTERIGAMKTFLLGYSEVFRAMLQDSKLAEKEDVRLKDADPETFKNFLKCVYGASSAVISQLSFEENAKLLYLAEKYLVNDLKADISERLLSLFSWDHVFFALAYPVLFENEVLNDRFQKLVKKNFDNIMKDPRLLECSEDAVLTMLTLPCISSLSEVEIWKIILEWAKHRTDSTDSQVVRSYMFKSLKYIRFLAMDYTDFWKQVVPTKVLLDEEVFEICKSFGTGNAHNIEHLCEEIQCRLTTFTEATINSNSNHITSNFIGKEKYAFIHWVVNDIIFHETKTYSKSYIWAEHVWAVHLGLFPVSGPGVNQLSINSIVQVILPNPAVQSFTGNVKMNIRKQNHSMPGNDLIETGVFNFDNLKLHFHFGCILEPNAYIRDNTIIVTAEIFLDS